VILGISNVDGILVALFDKNREKIAEKKSDGRDLLREISKLLTGENISPENIQKIFVVNGPGKFTAMREICVISNFLAAETGAELFPILADDFEKSGRNFSPFFEKKIAPQKKILPIFAGAPRIGKLKKAA